MRWIRIAVAALLTSCTAARYDRFEHYATGAIMAVDIAATVCDFGQTTHSSNHGRWDWGLVEANPVIGHRPTLDKILAMDIIGLAGGIIAARTLPRGWRLAFALAYTGIETWNVTHQGGSPKHPRPRPCGY